MREVRAILAAFERVVASKEQAVLASVIRTSGSTYRHAGAKALILADDSIVSIVSGGCLESDIVEQARKVRANGDSIIVRYDHREDDDVVWGLGLGCAGVVDVLLERVDAEHPGPLKLLEQVVASRQSGIMATVVSDSSAGKLGARWLQTGEGDITVSGNWSFLESLNSLIQDAVEQDNMAIIEFDDVQVLVERVQPLLRLLVFGAGADAVPLVAIASEIGWQTQVFDKRAAYAKAERFPGADQIFKTVSCQRIAEIDIDSRTVAVVMTHNYLQDLEILKALLPSPAHYIGVLGPKRRLHLLLKDLREEGWDLSEYDGERLHGPAGLDIGADTAEEIALSIVSEVQAVVNGRNGARLRDKSGPIHAVNQ